MSRYTLVIKYISISFLIKCFPSNAFTLTVKDRFDVEEYSFSQTTLEQVFIEFAKQQEAEDDEEDIARGRLEKILGRSQSNAPNPPNSPDSTDIPITRL